MSFLAKNLSNLRVSKKITQAEIQDRLGIKRNTWSNWENGKSSPDYDTVLAIAQFFDIDAGAMLFSDLENGDLIKKVKSTNKGDRKGDRTGDLILKKGFLKSEKTAFKTEDIDVQYGAKTPKIITLDSSGQENIIYVPIQARAGYLLGFGDPQYMETLPAFTLPGLRNGSYRMFEVDGVSMAPTLLHGDRVIGRWIENFQQIRENRIHVIVTREGVLVKRVLNRVSQRGKIVLKSDTITHRKDYPTYEINPEDVLELWYVVLNFTGDLSEPAEMYHRVADLEADMVEMRSITSAAMDEIKAMRAVLAKPKK